MEKNINRRIKILGFFIGGVASLLMISCTRVSNKPNVYWQGTDSYGRVVKLEKCPQRIISLSPCITESIFLLESESKLVGITDFCTYPEGVDSIFRVGTLLNLSAEQLCALNPDVIIVGSIISKDLISQLEKMNIPVLVLNAEHSVDEIYEVLFVLGDILNKQDLAKAKISDLKERMCKVKQAIKKPKNRSKVYYVVGFGDGGDYTAPASTHIDEVIEFAGGINVGSSLATWAISREFLFEQNPDVIFIRKEDVENFKKTPPYTQLEAVKKGRVYGIESGWIDIVSPRNILAVEFIAQKIKS